MKRFLILVIVFLLTVCASFAEESQFNSETNELLFHGFLLSIPQDFDCHDTVHSDAISGDIQRFYPERLDAQASLYIYVQGFSDVSEEVLMLSQSSMRDSIMKNYGLDKCMYETVVDFADTKALLYDFSSDKYANFYVAIAISKEDNAVVVLEQRTDATDTSNIPYLEDFLVMVFSSKRSSEVTSANNATPKPTNTPRPTMTPRQTEIPYDIDQDLTVAYCKPDAKYKTQYDIAFAEYRNGEVYRLYTFDSERGNINPRSMGKDFHAIGGLPSWFYTGATVHVQARLSGFTKINEYHCTVTKATGKNNIKSTKKPPIATATPKAKGNSSTPSKQSGGTATFRRTSGLNLYDAIISGERVFDQMRNGDSSWYTRSCVADDVSLEIVSKGSGGQIMIVCVMDMYRTGRTYLFYKTLNNVFSGDELIKASDWVSKNLGKERKTKIGELNIVLTKTVTNYPVMYIVDDDHLDYI